MTNSEASDDLPDKPTSESEQPDKATPDKEQPGKPPSDRNLKSCLRARLQLIGAALASIAEVGAIAGGLVGYWNLWKTIRTDVFPDKQQTQKEAAARPDIAPRLSLVVLPFVNLNNDPEQDYFADGITTDLTTDLAQMPARLSSDAERPLHTRTSRATLGRSATTLASAGQSKARCGAMEIRSVQRFAHGSSERPRRLVGSFRWRSYQCRRVAGPDHGAAARSLNIELIQAESRRTDRSRNPDAMDFSMRGWAKFYERSRRRKLRRQRSYRQCVTARSGQR